MQQPVHSSASDGVAEAERCFADKARHPACFHRGQTLGAFRQNPCRIKQSFVTERADAAPRYFESLNLSRVRSRLRKEYPLGTILKKSKTVTAYSAANGERKAEGVEIEEGMIAQ